jgi:6-phosphogluconolactonase
MTTTGGPYVFVGTYTDGASEGIYTCTFDGVGGELEPITSTDAGPNPSFLAIHPSGQYLYAVNEIDTGAVTALSIDRKSGELTVLNRVVTGGGADPCYCSVDETGRYVFLAHYHGGAVAVVPICDDGRLGEPTQVVKHEGSGPDPERQEASHPHSIRPGPGNRFVYVADLGTDEFYRYAFDAERGRLRLTDGAPLTLPPGAGPRHFDFHPSTDHIYLLNELNSTLSVVDADGETIDVVDSTSTLPADFEGDNLTADVHVDASGRRVYASNRGHHSIAVFEIDDETGTLSPTQITPSGGAWPRTFALSPTGSRLLVGNRQTDGVTRFNIDADDGTLDAENDVTEIPSPSCLLFAPTE